MKHPFSELRPEYERLLSICRVTRKELADATARRLLRSKARYLTVGSQTGVPAALLAALHERESSANFSTYLGNGEPLHRVTRLVPKGRGPWPNWETGAVDAIKYDHLNDNSAPWAMPYVCWKGEAWNGFGPRNRGIHTGYLWAGTNIYTRGKYVADGVWDANHVDTQLGMIPVMLSLFEIEPSKRIGDVLPMVAAPSAVPAPASAPEGLHAAKELQMALNKLGQVPPLLVDNSYGRRTREAVRAFQRKHKLTADGLAGPKTWAVIDREIKVST